MHVRVGDARLFFDVEGAKLTPDGAVMRERPTLILLHGAPGLVDHSTFRPAFAQLLDVAQVIYLDLRGGGRSDPSTPERWTLDQWADDLRAFCDALSIARPVVLGHSGGGFVAMAYATRHPEHPAKLILSSTQARLNVERSAAAFARRGGPAAGTAARNYLGGSGDAEGLAEYARLCLPLYNRATPDPDAGARIVSSPDLFLAFHTAPHGVWQRFNLLAHLARVRCPTLVLVGEDDPITPIEDAEDIVAALPPHLVRFERFPRCGHGVWHDEPQRAFAVIRDFLQT